MDRYANGDAAAFAEVYDLLAPRLLSFFRRGTGNEALSEELLQQTFLQMHLARERYQTGLDVVPWAFAIARRLRIDAYRKSGREVLGQDLGDRESEEIPPDEAAVLQQTADGLRRSLADLPAAQREAFELVKSEGLSLAQAAEALGTTVTAIKLRVHRASETLRLVARGP